jgi:adenine-specific DNA-methyltransferase
MIADINKRNRDIMPNSREIELLHRDFSECFNNEGKFDIAKFKAMISDKVDLITESQGFEFLGKSYARMLASMESTTVIVPDEEHNQKPENINSQNIYISGDNLDALKHLANSYAGQVKCIYIDPPYNTGDDGFTYSDKFDFKTDELAEKLNIDPEQAERIIGYNDGNTRSDASWLTFMLPRLLVAKDMLEDEGVIFISIDDNEQANLKLLCDEIFGVENFLATIPCRVRTAKTDVPFGVSQDYDWVLAYARTEGFMAGREHNRKYFETPDFPGRPWRYHDLSTQRTAKERPNSDFTMINPKNGAEYPVNKQRVWCIAERDFDDYYYNKHTLIFPGDYDFLTISNPVMRYWKEGDMKKKGDDFGQTSVSTMLPNNIGLSKNGTQDFDELFHAKLFSYPKPVALIKYLIDMALGTNNHDAVIVDFFSGSATTAQAVMELNAEKQKDLTYILVQLPEKTKKDSEAYGAGYKTIDAIGMERIRRAAKKIKDANPLFHGDLGFKHYTLQELPEDTVEKLEEFKPAEIPDSNKMLELMGGKKAVLSTWLCDDGYGLDAKVEYTKLGGYTAYYIDKHIYFIDGGFDDHAMGALMEKYDRDSTDFHPSSIVVFGYSFSLAEMLMLKKNIPALRDNESGNNINIDVRY